MEGGPENPSARRNYAGTIPSFVTDPLLRKSSWANSGVKEARLSCCKLVLLAGDVRIFRVALVVEFQLIFHLSRHIQLLLHVLGLLFPHFQWITQGNCRISHADWS